MLSESIPEISFILEIGYTLTTSIRFRIVITRRRSPETLKNEVFSMI
jgi:hypothetical protein